MTQQFQCPPNGEGINKLWNFNTIEYHSTVPSNELTDRFF